MKESTLNFRTIQKIALSAALAAVCAQVTAQSQSKPSFDCAKATTSIEKAICSNPLLGKLDVALAENYKQMMMADLGKGGQANVKAEQRQWVQARNKCQDLTCLEQSYRKRVDETCEYGVVSGTHPICTMSEDVK